MKRNAGFEDGGAVLSTENRLRAAKQYVDDLCRSEFSPNGIEQNVVDKVHKKLRQDVIESSGRLKKELASQISSANVIRTIRKHKAPVTSCSFSVDGNHIFSGCKQGQLVKCDVETGSKTAAVSLSSACMCLGTCSDGRYLAAGTQRGELVLLDPNNLQIVKTFSAHRGSLNGLAFRAGSHQLFTCGADKLLKVWEPDHGGFIEVLCGHTDSITSISCLVRERPLTAGGQDSSLRIWKIVEESQLVYNMPSLSCCCDCCCYVDDTHFMSGSTDGALSLWASHSKTPLYTLKAAHGETGASSWLSSVAALPYSDVAASGAANGFVRLWEVKYTNAGGRGNKNMKKNDGKMLREICSVPVSGCINGLQFSSDCSLLAAAVGREYRFGRWTVPKDAKNSVALIRIDKD